MPSGTAPAAQSSQQSVRPSRATRDRAQGPKAHRDGEAARREAADAIAPLLFIHSDGPLGASV